MNIDLSQSELFESSAVALVMPPTARAPSLPGLRPVAELARNRVHGDRLRYLAGCRCDACREANASYEHARYSARKSGQGDALVDASRARVHLASLSTQGVGYKTAADAAGVSAPTVLQIITGRRSFIRATTERRLLSVTAHAAADRAVVDGDTTRRMLQELIREGGYTKQEIAKALGLRRLRYRPSPQRVTVRSAFDVQRLHEKWMCCDAQPTLALLLDLSEEGFHRDRVARELASLALELRQEPPDLTVRNGRIRQSSARLVRELHRRLVGDDLIGEPEGEA